MNKGKLMKQMISLKLIEIIFQKCSKIKLILQQEVILCLSISYPFFFSHYLEPFFLFIFIIFFLIFIILFWLIPFLLLSVCHQAMNLFSLCKTLWRYGEQIFYCGWSLFLRFCNLKKEEIRNDMIMTWNFWCDWKQLFLLS